MITLKGRLQNAVSLVAGLGRKLNAVCFSCNGSVRIRDGVVADAVMGVGTARWASATFQGLAKKLGSLISVNNRNVRVFIFKDERRDYDLVALKTKMRWHDTCTYSDIIQVARQLKTAATENGWETVVLPVIGTGSGKLPHADTMQLLHDELDDRFILIDYSDEGKANVATL